MNKPTRDRFFVNRAAIYRLKVTGEGVEPIRESKVAIPMIDFKNVDYIEEKKGKTIVGMTDGVLFEIELDFEIIHSAFLRYKRSL